MTKLCNNYVSRGHRVSTSTTIPSHAYKPTPPPAHQQLELIETFQLRGTDINFLVHREIGQAERIKFM